MSPASNHSFDENGKLINSESWFKWYYEPKTISFQQALDEFITLFERIMLEQSQGKKVILPLSGGLDSRTQATALNNLKSNVYSYSYAFENGYREDLIASKIAARCNFEFRSFRISKGYLWDKIDQLAALNQCYSDFTSPRQMAIYDKFEDMGDMFSLGHWGDVLFDSMGLPQLSLREQTEVIKSKLLKRGGLQIASELWQNWNLSGSYEDYFDSRIETLLKHIDIDDTNAKLRAFKSLYWAPRWTSVNLSIFNSVKPISLPYYDDRMCEFICRIPEEFLQDRKIQIAYIKARAPGLAKVNWQDQRPFNLYNYHNNKVPYNLPYRIKNKIGRILSNLSGRPYVQRNWELQFLGVDNMEKLKDQLFCKPKDGFIPEGVIHKYYESFAKNSKLLYAHPINMLLVLSKFNQIYYDA